VKLFAAITVAIETKIPSDPFASHFALTGALKRYGRVKKMGLPQRYRLFFRAFDTPELSFKFKNKTSIYTDSLPHNIT
jgi:toxin YhaV